MNFPLVPPLWACYQSQNVVHNSFSLERIRALTGCSIIIDAVGTCKFIIYFCIFLDVGGPRDWNNFGRFLIYWAFFTSLGYLFISNKQPRVHRTHSTGSLLAGNRGGGLFPWCPILDIWICLAWKGRSATTLSIGICFQFNFLSKTLTVLRWLSGVKLQGSLADLQHVQTLIENSGTLEMIKNKYHQDTENPQSQPIRGICCMTIKNPVLILRWWQISDYLIFRWENKGSWRWKKGYGGHLWYLAVSGEHVRPELTNLKKNEYLFLIWWNWQHWGNWTAVIFRGWEMN